MKTLPKNAYGLLLTFDGYGANLSRCRNIGRLYQFLYDLPAVIGMRRIGFPQIVSIDEPGIRGLSGFTFIMESHISIHTYEERGFVTVDIYSCKSFDIEMVISLVADYFKTDSFATQIVVRGKDFDKLDPQLRKRRRMGK